MKKKIRNAIVRLLIIGMLTSETAGSVPSVYAGDDADVSQTGLSCEQEEQSDESRIYAAGYIAQEEELNVPAMNAGVGYAQAMDELVSDRNADEPELLYAAKPDDDFPCSYDMDWLSYFKGKYPPTRDQGKYATCWAHSAMTLAEFYMINSGLADKSVDYSDLHMAYWTYTQGTASDAAGDTRDRVIFDAISENGIDNILNNGGSLKFAAETLMRNRGAASEKSAPYSGADLIAAGGALPATGERTDVAYLKNACLISIRFNEAQVKEAIVENGAAGIAIYADKQYYDEEHNSYFCGNTTSTNHALTVVGWDDYFPGEAFKECDGQLPARDGAWLVRNSWSTESEASYESYFWLSYYDTSISGAWVYQMMPDFPWDNHYYYDSQIHGNGRYEDVCEYANVFTVNGKAEAEGERLEAVGFEMAMVQNSGSHYQIKIYGNLTGDTPDTGTLIRSATTEGTVYFEGVYTVSLNSPVVLDRGEKFAVVISFDKPGSSVVMESTVEDYNGINSKVGISSGQSFVSTDRTSWADVKSSDKTYGNLVISAMTSDTQKKSAVSKLLLTPEVVTFTKKDESRSLSLKLLDINGEEAPLSEYSYVNWTSADNNTAVVDALGNVKAVANGRTTISAAYNGYKAECDVNVVIPVEGYTAIPVADIKNGTEIDWASDKLSLTCSTEGADIYYTLDGSKAGTDSIKYTGPISFNAAMAGKEVSVNAIAAAAGLRPSDNVSFNFIVPTKGKLKISASAKGSVIRSTIPGNVSLQAKLTLGDKDEQPEKGFWWFVEDEDILRLSSGSDTHPDIARLTGLQNGSTLVSVSACNALGESLSANISISVDIASTGDVHITPVSVNYLYAGDEISLSCETAGAYIYYTLDGTEATTDSILYTAPVKVSPDKVGSQLKINAIAIKEGMFASASVSACYAIKRGKPGKSPFDPEPDKAGEDGNIYLVKGQSFYADSSIKWISKAPKIVSVDSKGRVKAKKAGSGRIESADDPSIYMDVIITLPVVSTPKKTLVSGEVSSVSLNCLIGGTDKSDRYKNYVWVSSNEEVLKVDEQGRIEAIGSGSATISAYMAGTSFGIKIAVKDQAKIGKFSSSENRISLELSPLQKTKLKIKGIKLKKCSIESEGLSASLNKKGRISAYYNDIISITPSGKISATGAGSCELIIIPDNDPEGKIYVDIHVNEPVERIYYMQPGKSRSIRIKGVKNSGKNAAKWFSDNEETAVVNKGKITACTDGEALISCSYNGFDFKVRVYVYEAVLKTDEKLQIRGNDYELLLSYDDEPYELNWVNNPYQKAVFKNSNSTVAFCDMYEVIHVRGRGKTVLTTTMHGKKIRIKVTVQ
ncbi:MAG: chitobiase/beta-hexosaminidase C-terminal domain-containing protein [Lachnospiraceae bacterium]|nr:chitobiase/beta-hexosaminidase C-terminal domain-containing protein [Lachnospiraceae bacterium]